MRVYDRAAKMFREETEYGGKGLNFLYNNAFGRVLLKLFFCRRLYSKLNGAYMKSRMSAKRIAPFIKKYSIDLNGCANTDFKSFDDFFTRRYDFSADCASDELISTCCGRLCVYPISNELTLKIKGSCYTLAKLAGSFDVTEFNGGVCLVFRLAVEDCHRYVFFDDGRVIRVEDIPGVLHTVRPISEKYRVFSHNHRVASLLETEHFGEVIQIEVGALQVGKITNHNVTTFSRMEEKGFFSFGGSTIIQLFKKDTITVSDDIETFSAKGTEVLVKTGEKIGGRTRC